MEDTEVLCKVVLEAFGYTLDLNAPSHRVAVDKVRTELREGKASPKSHDNRVEAAQLILAANGVYGEAQKLNVLSFVVNSPLDVYEGVSQALYRYFGLKRSRDEVKLRVLVAMYGKQA